jgi:hypothetical protein
VLCVASACGRVGFEPVGSPNADANADSSDAALGPRPVAWWKLDETSGTVAADSAGTTPGSFSGSGLVWTAIGSPVGRALLFPGGAGVDLGAAPALANLPALTMVAWIEPATTSVDGNSHCFVDKGSNVSPIGGWSFDHSQDADGDLVFHAYFGPGDELRHSTGAGALAPGTWARVAVTWDGSRSAANAHLYIDGVEPTYALTIDALGSRPGDATIGAALGCSVTGAGYVGMLSDVRIYDRVLDASELAQL